MVNRFTPLIGTTIGMSMSTAASGGTVEASTVRTFRPIVVSGPSGGGKSTILKKLFENYPKSFAFSVSHTTRKPRSGESHGKDYYFVDRDVMQKAIDNGEFVEFATFGGNLYGTSKQAVCDIQSSGKICILDLELQGVRAIKKTDLNSRYVYVKPPSVDELEKRLRARATETEESLQKRLNQAKVDMAAIEKEPHLFDCVILNDNLQAAYDEFWKFVAPDLDEQLHNGTT